MVLNKTTPSNATRIHIVGCLSRSGTTLVHELMKSCFNIDAYCEHEENIYKLIHENYNILLTKRPKDIHHVRFPLLVDKSLFVIYVLRDPRDVVCSRSHKKNLDGRIIAGSLSEWKSRQNIAKTYTNHPRFITIKYEDMVTNPDSIQDLLLHRIPKLEKKAKFSEYEKVSNPSQKSLDALGSLRPISTQSIGNWKKNVAILKEQIETHGDICDELIECNYEQNKDWLSELGQLNIQESKRHLNLKSRVKKAFFNFYHAPRLNLIYLISLNQHSRKLLRIIRRFIRTL